MGVINKLSDLGGSQDSIQLPYEAEFYGYESSSTENIGIHRKNHNKKTEQTKKANQNTKIKEKTKTRTKTKRKQHTNKKNKKHNQKKLRKMQVLYCCSDLLFFCFVFFWRLFLSSCFVGDFVFDCVFLLKSTFSVLHGFIILWSMVDITN